MAVFESGLFSRLSGSFGNVTMYRLGDSNVVKGKRWARDARTPSQLIHRHCFMIAPSFSTWPFFYIRF